MKKIVLSILLLSIFSITFSQDKKEKKWTLNGYVKYLNLTAIDSSDGYWATENLIHNRLWFEWDNSKKLKASIHARTRLFTGDFVKGIPDYDKLINIESGYLDLSDNLLSGNSYLLHSTIDRIWFDYTKGSWQIRVGRQRINWGQNFVWNPNDLFNNSSFFDFDYEEKKGSDAIRIQKYIGATSVWELAVKANSDNEITAATFYKLNKWNYDFQFLGGILNSEDYTIGVGWSGQINNVAFRGESSLFHPKTNFKDTSSIFVASIGLDYLFKNSLFLQAEALYNGNGKDDSDFNLSELYYNTLTPKNLSLTELMFLLIASKPISPLVNANVSSMYSPNDNSMYVGSGLSFSLGDNLSFSINSQTFFSVETSEGRGSFVFLRFKQNF